MNTESTDEHHEIHLPGAIDSTGSLDAGEATGNVLRTDLQAGRYSHGSASQKATDGRASAPDSGGIGSNQSAHAWARRSEKAGSPVREEAASAGCAADAVDLSAMSSLTVSLPLDKGETPMSQQSGESSLLSQIQPVDAHVAAELTGAPDKPLLCRLLPMPDHVEADYDAVRQIDPEWRTTFPERLTPLDDEWLPGFTLRCDEANHWRAGASIAITTDFSTGRTSFARAGQYVVATSFNLAYLAESVKIPLARIEETTFLRELRVLYPKHGGASSPGRTSRLLGAIPRCRVCPTCIETERLILRTSALPLVATCPIHLVMLQSRCVCGSPIRWYGSESAPFTCYHCDRPWSKLPALQAENSIVQRDRQALALYDTLMGTRFSTLGDATTGASHTASAELPPSESAAVLGRADAVRALALNQPTAQEALECIRLVAHERGYPVTRFPTVGTPSDGTCDAKPHWLFDHLSVEALVNVCLTIELGPDDLAQCLDRASQRVSKKPPAVPQQDSAVSPPVHQEPYEGDASPSDRPIHMEEILDKEDRGASNSAASTRVQTASAKRDVPQDYGEAQGYSPPGAQEIACPNQACECFGQIGQNNIRRFGMWQGQMEHFCAACGSRFVGSRLVMTFDNDHGSLTLRPSAVVRAQARLSLWRTALHQACSDMLRDGEPISIRAAFTHAHIPHSANLLAQGLGLRRIVEAAVTEQIQQMNQLGTLGYGIPAVTRTSGEETTGGDQQATCDRAAMRAHQYRRSPKRLFRITPIDKFPTSAGM